MPICYVFLFCFTLLGMSSNADLSDYANTFSLSHLPTLWLYDHRRHLGWYHEWPAAGLPRGNQTSLVHLSRSGRGSKLKQLESENSWGQGLLQSIQFFGGEFSWVGRSMKEVMLFEMWSNCRGGRTTFFYRCHVLLNALNGSSCTKTMTI